MRARDHADIQGPPWVRMEGVDTQFAVLSRGPGRSRRPLDLATTCAFVVGGALLVWSASIHFHLWHDEGYHAIATIGPLFLLQSVAGLVIGLAVVAVRRMWVAVIGAGFALATLAGFLISLERGLFGFKDSWQAPFAHQAFAIELGAAVVLAAAAALCFVGSAPRTRAGTPAAGAAT
jgi:hypothetical protein